MTGPWDPRPPEDDVAVDAIPYLLGVEVDLVRAASVDRHAAPGPRRPGLVALVTAAAVLLVGLLAGLFGSGGARPASALRFTVVEDRITIDVVDADATPERVEAELRAAGIAAAIVRASAPPSLDGRLVAVAQGGGDEVEGTDLDGDGVIDRIVLSEGFTGTLELVIADVDADPSTALGTSGPPRDCELLIDRPVSDVADQLAEVSTSIVWSRWIVEGDEHDVTRVDSRTDLPDDDTVVELFIDATGELHVTTTPTPDAIEFPFPASRCG